MNLNDLGKKILFGIATVSMGVGFASCAAQPLKAADAGSNNPSFSHSLTTLEIENNGKGTIQTTNSLVSFNLGKNDVLNNVKFFASEIGKDSVPPKPEPVPEPSPTPTVNNSTSASNNSSSTVNNNTQPTVSNNNNYSNNTNNTNNNSYSAPTQQKSNPSPTYNNPAPAPTTQAPAPVPSDPILWSDYSIGALADPNHVPCGGLWTYTSSNFFARELNCPGSAAYLSIGVGQKIKINNHTCTMVGAQVLNLDSNNMGDVRWIGNTIVQTCFPSGGNVRLVNFNCS